MGTVDRGRFLYYDFSMTKGDNCFNWIMGARHCQRELRTLDQHYFSSRSYTIHHVHVVQSCRLSLTTAPLQASMNTTSLERGSEGLLRS
jgi:hypothetical protein